MEELFKSGTQWIALGVEGAAALVIAIAANEATLRALALFVVRPPKPDTAKEGVRLRLARWLAVALEFTLAADILRTAMNFFLQREIEQNEARRHGAGAAE